MARCMAAARFGVTPGAFVLLPPGEQVLCMDADRVMREMEAHRHEDLVRAVLRVPQGLG